METKTTQAIIEKSNDDQIHFIMSATTVDRDGDSIEKSAYDSATKIDKLPALFNHQADKPFGYWKDIRVVADTLKGTLVTASTNLGKMIKQLIDDGVPLSSSIGFRGKGDRKKNGGIHFKELELLECSVVSIPAHPRAVQVAKSHDLAEYVESQSSTDNITGESAEIVEKTLLKSKAAILAVNKLRKKS
jgi:HK97 family phage prohead protease